MATVYINKLLKSTDAEGDVKPYFYIQTKWLDDQVIVKLQDSQTSKCYQGSVSVGELKDSAAELDVPYTEYYDECRLSLTTNIALPGCTYKLDEEQNVLKVWKAQQDSIPMLYLEISLKIIRNHYEILDSAIDVVHSQTKSLTDRVEKAHKFDQHSRELLEDYRLCVEEKNQLERKLLRKVAVLLNSKKQKIAELEERLRKYEKVRDDEEGDVMEETDSEDKPQSSGKRRRNFVVESDTEDEEDFLVNTEQLVLPTKQSAS